MNPVTSRRTGNGKEITFMDKQNEDLSRDWAAADQRGDVDYLERLLADDFVGIGPRGFMLTKDQWLERHKTGDLRYQSLTLDEMAMRVYGDAAIVTARETAEATYKGQSTPGQF